MYILVWCISLITLFPCETSYLYNPCYPPLSNTQKVLPQNCVISLFYISWSCLWCFKLCWICFWGFPQYIIMFFLSLTCMDLWVDLCFALIFQYVLYWPVGQIYWPVVWIYILYWFMGWIYQYVLYWPIGWIIVLYWPVGWIYVLYWPVWWIYVLF